MKILIIGGMHGNEPLGIDLVKIFQKKPIKNIDCIYANMKAIQAKKRFTNADLNRSFPGNKDNTYEQRRAREIVRLTANYDIVFDFHNTHCPNNNCSFVGINADKKLYDVSAFFGLRKVIVADYDCLNKYASNCISIEISLRSRKMDTQYWYNKIVNLSSLNILPKAVNIEKYQFVYRMTLEDKETYNLPAKNMRAFKKISKKLALNMGVLSPAFPIFINDAYTPYNYGGLLNKKEES